MRKETKCPVCEYIFEDGNIAFHTTKMPPGTLVMPIISAQNYDDIYVITSEDKCMIGAKRITGEPMKGRQGCLSSNFAGKAQEVPQGSQCKIGKAYPYRRGAKEEYIRGCKSVYIEA
jgi:hypothetical protein